MFKWVQVQQIKESVYERTCMVCARVRGRLGGAHTVDRPRQLAGWCVTRLYSSGVWEGTEFSLWWARRAAVKG